MLHVNDLTHRIGDRLLFDRATVALPPDARVGLVGRNGAGKTTLFRIICGEAAPEGGSVNLPKNIRIGRVAQEAPGGPETLMEVVLAAATERAALLAERETATDPTRIAEVETRLVDIEAHSAPARAGAILHGLGFDAEAQARPCSDFSGGWRMRVALAAVLFSEPDLLLLDEPTNYLDLEGTLWLYDYLSRYPRTALIISHDRELLDESVDHILHLTEGRLALYKGNYSQFERQRREQLILQGKMRERQVAERAHLQAFVDRFRAKASKAKQAQSRVKRLEKMEPIAAVVEEAVLPFSIPSPERPLSPPLVAMDGVAAGYGERIVLDRLGVSLLPDDRVALIGPNGNGKSTFAKVLTRRLAPMKGEVRASRNLRVAYFAQHQLDELDEKGSPYSHIAARMPDAFESKRRAMAARFGFPGGRADTSVSRLSGGEKARLLLGLVTMDGPHLLVLDEPTNHLDIDARAALVTALNDYEGAVVMVTHDRFLIEACAERLWLVADGTVRPFEGDVDAYRQTVLSGGASRKEPRVRAEGRERAAPPRRRAELQPLRKRLGEVEARMEKLRTVLAKLETALAAPDLFRTDPIKGAELARLRADAAGGLARAEEDWLELSEALERADAA